MTALKRPNPISFFLLFTLLLPQCVDAALPDTLIVEDYKGPDDTGDQGGFVKMSFPTVVDTTVTHYRVFREMTLSSAVDDNGNVIDLNEPVTRFVSWASVVQPETDSLIVAIVPTIDNKPTRWGVRAETDSTEGSQVGALEMLVALGFEDATIDSTTEVVFDPQMVELDPRLPIVDAMVDTSELRISTFARAVDNIPPSTLRRIEGGHQDGEITLTWELSVDDRVVGYIPYRGLIIPIPGVTEYHIYEGTSRESLSLVARAPSGVTSVSTSLKGCYVRIWRIDALDSDNQPVGPTTSVSYSGVGCGQPPYISGFGTPVYILAPTGETPFVQDFDDFLYFIDSFMKSWEDSDFLPAADTNEDGIVDFTDFLNFAGAWGETAVTFNGLPVGTSGKISG